MNFSNLVLNIRTITFQFISIASITYDMIVNNILILCFVLMCAIFVGLALLKRLIHIN